MPQFVVFLRAVNVGGRKLPMAEARAALDESGFSDVQSHIQTGNFLIGTSLRSAATVSRHHPASTSAAASVCGTSGAHAGNGCVGEASSPGTSLFGTGRSSTGTSGLPVSRSSTNSVPIFVLTATAGRPRKSISSGAAATS